MMTPYLSRRLARCRHADAIYDKGASWWGELCVLAEEGRIWSVLPTEYKKVILAAEKELELDEN